MAPFRWVMLAAAALGSGSGLPAFGYVSSLFQVPLQREFGWTRAQMGAALAGFTLTALLSPFVGRLVDRRGALRVASFAIVLLASSEVGLSFVTANIWSFYLLFVATLTFGMGAGPVPYTRAILPGFPDTPGLALGVVLAGSGSVSIFLPPLLSAIIANFGWRAGYCGLGLCTLVLGAVAIVGVAKGQRRIAAQAAASAARDDAQPVETGLTVREGLGSWRFWLIALVIFLVTIPSIGFATNLQALVIELGIAPSYAAWLISVLAMAIIIGGLGIGWLLDQFWAPGVAAGLFVVAALGTLLFILDTRSSILTLLGVLFLGVAQGVEVQLLGYLVRRYFGLKSYGTLVSSALLGYALAMPIGSVSFGMSHDLTGSYRPALIFSGILLLLAAAAVLGLGRYPALDTDRRA